jgi:hypothetical protein
MATNSYTQSIQTALTTYGNNTYQLLNQLNQIHQAAKTAGDEIIYPSNQEITLNIDNTCLGLIPLPLPENIDFNGCTFRVTNTASDPNNTLFLFAIGENDYTHLPSISIANEDLHLNAYINDPSNPTSPTPKLIIVHDDNLWTRRTVNNTNIDYYRFDLLFLAGNIIQNNPIFTYETLFPNPSLGYTSAPTCRYADVTLNQKTFRNIVFIREYAGTNAKVINLARIKCQYNYLIDNVTVYTKGFSNDNTTNLCNLVNDQCFLIEHSAKVKMSNIFVLNTYSKQDTWGYAFELNNVWDCSFEKLQVTSIRGGFNVTCANKMTYRDSTLNRVDVHYYGRDIVCENCTFINTVNNFHVYNRFSSFYGTLRYIHCVFDNFLPVRIDSDYNAFTPFEVEIRHCVQKVSGNSENSFNCICHIPVLKSETNTRTELANKCLPNLKIDDYQIVAPSTVSTFFLFIISSKPYTGSVYGMETYDIYDIVYTHESNATITFYDSNFIMSALALKSKAMSSITRRITLS